MIFRRNICNPLIPSLLQFYPPNQPQPPINQPYTPIPPINPTPPIRPIRPIHPIRPIKTCLVSEETASGRFDSAAENNSTAATIPSLSLRPRDAIASPFVLCSGIPCPPSTLRRPVPSRQSPPQWLAPCRHFTPAPFPVCVAIQSRQKNPPSH